ALRQARAEVAALGLRPDVAEDNNWVRSVEERLAGYEQELYDVRLRVDEMPEAGDAEAAAQAAEVAAKLPEDDLEDLRRRLEWIEEQKSVGAASDKTDSRQISQVHNTVCDLVEQVSKLKKQASSWEATASSSQQQVQHLQSMIEKRQMEDSGLFRGASEVEGKLGAVCQQVADMAARLLEVEGNLDFVRENETANLGEADDAQRFAATLQAALDAHEPVPVAESSAALLSLAGSDRILPCALLLRAAAYVALAEAEDPLQSESASALLLRAQRAFRAWQGEEYLSAGGPLGTVPYGPELLKLIRRLHCRQGSGDEARCSLPLENESCNPEVVQAALGLVEEWATDRRDQNDCVAEPFVVAEVVGVVAGDGNDCTLRLLEKLDQGCSTTAPSAVVLRPEDRAASQLRRQARSQGLQGRVRILGLGPSLQDVVDEGVAVLFVNAAPGGHLEALQSAKQLLSLGQIASLVTELQNPHFVPGASDPLDIFELLVWHGYLIAPMEDPNRPFTMVGEVQQFVGDPSGLPRLRVVARLRRRQGRRWRSPAPSSGAGCLALGTGKGERPNSWAEVDESELL
ncbi:unnamed protein product, partial [Polarella glacialis]